jgi:hypothetical protein
MLFFAAQTVNTGRMQLITAVNISNLMSFFCLRQSDWRSFRSSQGCQPHVGQLAVTNAAHVLWHLLFSVSCFHPKIPTLFRSTEKFSSVFWVLWNKLEICVDRDSSVGIATGYGLDGPRIESRWGASFSVLVQTGPGAHPGSYTMGTGSFPGVNCGRSVALTTHSI